MGDNCMKIIGALAGMIMDVYGNKTKMIVPTEMVTK